MSDDTTKSEVVKNPEKTQEGGSTPGEIEPAGRPAGAEPPVRPCPRWSATARACSVRRRAATPPATARSVGPSSSPSETARPYGGYFDEVADSLERALVGGRRPSARPSRGRRRPRRERRSTSTASTCRPSIRVLRDDPAPLRDLHRRVRGALPRPRGRGAARGLPPSVDHQRQQAGSSRGVVPGRRPAHPVHRRHLPGQRLARARDVGHVRDHLRRPPGPDPDPHARRLAGPPQRKDYPLGGIPVEYKGATVPPPDQRRSYT